MESAMILEPEFLVDLKRQGQLFGANDLWIAATALAHKLPLVTRNRTRFERVPGLDVRPY